MFKKADPQVKYILVEIEKASRLPEMNGDLKESLKALQYQPAFQYILHKLDVQKALVQKMLAEGYELDDKQLRYLQAGVYWLSHIKREMDSLSATPPQAQREASFDEASDFARINANLDLVGV